jgi:hypothetical protein
MPVASDHSGIGLCRSLETGSRGRLCCFPRSRRSRLALARQEKVSPKTANSFMMARICTRREWHLEVFKSRSLVVRQSPRGHCEAFSASMGTEQVAGLCDVSYLARAFVFHS